MLKFSIKASFVAIQENVVHDLSPSSHDYNDIGPAAASSVHSPRGNPDGPLGDAAHATLVTTKAECRRHFESGLQRYMHLVKSRGWAMYSADLLFAVSVQVSDVVTGKTTTGLCAAESFFLRHVQLFVRSLVACCARACVRTCLTERETSNALYSGRRCGVL